MGAGYILDLRSMFTGSPFEKVLVETLQSQAMRLAVSLAMGPAPWMEGFLEGASGSEACWVLAAVAALSYPLIRLPCICPKLQAV